MSRSSISLSSAVEGSYPCLANSRAQPPWTAHGRIAALVESPGAIDLAGDADAHAAGDPARGPWRRRQPQLARGAEIDAVAPPVDGQRGRQPARSPGQIADAAGAAPKPHHV